MYMKRVICIVTFFPLKPRNVRQSGGCLKNDRSRQRAVSDQNLTITNKPCIANNYVFANGIILNKVVTFSALCYPILIRNFVSCSFSGTNVFMASTS